MTQVWTAQARTEAAARGEALPDGSFPVQDVGDLLAAIQAVRRVPEHRREEVEVHLRTRGFVLGLTAAGYDAMWATTST